MFMIHSQTKFHIPSSNGSLVIAINPKDKEKFRTFTMLLHCIIQKYLDSSSVCVFCFCFVCFFICNVISRPKTKWRCVAPVSNSGLTRVVLPSVRNQTKWRCSRNASAYTHSMVISKAYQQKQILIR
jgi:hypothetical protein